ncbi:nucleotidyltransferase [Chitinophaga lutea]
MILARDFEDFVKLLNEHKVDYMVVGGYSLAFHGKPRHTGDLDIWINISPKNAERMLKVIADFGMASLGFEKDDFMIEGFFNQIGQPPLCIDILNSIDGVEFSEAKKNRQQIMLDNGLELSFIGLQDLLKNKQAAGRNQDIADIKEIKKIFPKTRPGKGRPPKR